jgi:hypothetical protein
MRQDVAEASAALSRVRRVAAHVVSLRVERFCALCVVARCMKLLTCNQAASNVQKRIEFIKAELKRADARVAEVAPSTNALLPFISFTFLTLLFTRLPPAAGEAARGQKGPAHAAPGQRGFCCRLFSPPLPVAASISNTFLPGSGPSNCCQSCSGTVTLTRILMLKNKRIHRRLIPNLISRNRCCHVVEIPRATHARSRGIRSAALGNAVSDGW